MRRKIENLYVKKICKIAVIASIAFLLVFISEFIVRGDSQDVLRWMAYFKLEFMLAFLLVLCVLLAATFLFNHIAYGYLLTSVLICTTSIINFYKLDIKGEQLSVQDFALASELATMAGDLEIKVSPHLIWSILFLLVVFLILTKINFINLKNRRRWVSLIVCVLLGVGVYENIYASEPVLKNSFLLTLVSSARASNIEQPEGYSKEHIQTILEGTEVNSIMPQVKPNIIMIMDESFFDITTVKSLSLSEDPLKNFKHYQSKFTSGNIIGPKIGGYTAQTEYEVLTGNSTDFTGVNNIAYIRYIKPDIDSLVNVFKTQGYYATAIHPYDRQFYSRDEVYEKMGFDQFITQESFENSETINGYITDEEVFEKLIKEYETHDETPFFAHIVTMQNHTPFPKNTSPSVKVLNTNFSDTTKDGVESYASAIKATDESLDALINYFDKIKEPTVIVVFGDHIPILGDTVYEELGYLKYNQPGDYRNGASTPFLMWNNFDLPRQTYDYIDSSYLGAILLDTIGFKQNQYFNYLFNQIEGLKAYHTEFFIDGDGKFRDHGDLKETEKKILEDMWQLQYDRLFGE